MTNNNSSIKKVLINSGIYSITSILQKAIGFLLLPLYTLYLTPEDYGITGIVNSFTIMLTLLFTLSLNSSVQRYYYIYNGDVNKLKSFYGTIITFVFVNSISLSILIVIFHEWLITPLIEGVTFYPYMFIGVLTVIFNPVYTIYQSLLQTMQKGKEFGKNSLLHFLTLVLLNLLFIVILKLGAVGQLYSYLLTAIIFGLYSIISLYSRKIISFKFNRVLLKQALGYSVPLLPHLMSSSIATFISRLFLNNQISTGSAGLFNIGGQFMLLIETLQMSVNSAYLPWFYNKMDKGEKSREQIIRFSDVLSKLYLLVGIMMSFFIKEVIFILLPPDFLIAWTIIPIMLIAYQVKSIYLFYVNTLFYNTSSTKYIFIASLTGSIVNIIFTAIYTKELGLVTPAVAMLLQWIFTVVIVIFISNKVEPVKFKLGKMVSYVFILVLSIVIGQFFDFRYPLSSISIWNLVYKIVIFIIVSFILLRNDIPIVISSISSIIKKRFIS